MNDYTDAQLEALADEFEQGIDLSHATWRPGSYAWLLDVIDDFDAFQDYLTTRGLTMDEFLKQAVTSYLSNDTAA